MRWDRMPLYSYVTPQGGKKTLAKLSKEYPSVEFTIRQSHLETYAFRYMIYATTGRSTGVVSRKGLASYLKK